MILQIAENCLISDCGSCLFPMMGISMMQTMPGSEYKNLAFNVYSCYRKNGKRIHANNFIQRNEYQECDNAIKRIVPAIDMNVINEIIEEIENISDVEKNFYKRVLEIRYRDILKPTLKRILKKEKRINEPAKGEKELIPKL